MGFQDRLKSLTAEQLAVLEGVARHQSSKEIARRLAISPHTVDQRIKRIQSKLDVATRADAARLYMVHLGHMNEEGGLLGPDGEALVDPALYAGTIEPLWRRPTNANAFLQDAQAGYSIDTWNAQSGFGFSNWIQKLESPNTLTKTQRSLVILTLMLAAVIIVSALVSLATNISQL